MMNKHIQILAEKAGAHMLADSAMRRFVDLLVEDINTEILCAQTCDPHTGAPYFTPENHNLRDLVEFFREWYGVGDES
jgi:hypothetical protein